MSARPSTAASAAQSLIVNGERHVTSACTLAELLDELNYGDAKVATAVDGDFVPAGNRADTRLADGARVEIVAPRQGG